MEVIVQNFIIRKENVLVSLKAIKVITFVVVLSELIFLNTTETNTISDTIIEDKILDYTKHVDYHFKQNLGALNV